VGGRRDHPICRRRYRAGVTTILVPYHLDESQPDLDWPMAADQTVTVDLPDGDPWTRMAALYTRAADVVAEVVTAGRVPTVMSGDCTTSFATVAGLQRAGIHPSIVWLDAHGDVQTPQTSASGYLGGMPLRQLVGFQPELIMDGLGIMPVREEQVLLVDARDLDPPEAEYLSQSWIRRCEVTELTKELLPSGPIYLHLDVDVVSDVELSGLLFPVAGGPSLSEVSQAVQRVLATGRVVAFGLACTWKPGHGNGASVAGML
jgi:arginase